MIRRDFVDGVVINGDCLDFEVREAVGNYHLIVTDPPYGNIVKEKWDFYKDETVLVEWMHAWTNVYKDKLPDNAAFYVFGGVGKPGFRPFFRYLSEVETPGFRMKNLITWNKKRAYGVQDNYLWTREELAYLVKGNPTFNIPLLEKERGYAGYNPKYPAKSKFLRRTNVWSDVSEIFRGKVHPTEKPQRLYEIPIETHTRQGDTVLDMFAGSGVCGLAARKLGRNFILIEKDPAHYETICRRLA